MTIVVSLLGGAIPAGAVPASKLAQARTVKKQVDALDRRAEIAADRYQEAAVKHGKLLAEKRAASRQLSKTKAKMAEVQLHLNTRANNMYRSGQSMFVDVLLGAQSFEDFATTWEFLRNLNESDAAAVAELKDLRAKYRREHKTLADKEKRAAAQRSAMRTNYRIANQALQERKRKLQGLEAEIAQLEASDRRRRLSWARSARDSSADRNFPPPTRAARSEVVNIARRYIGAPYVWAASGPNSFDCSGFTMFVYRQVGVSLPHSSRAQIGYGERVSRSNLEPGDLVFFGSPIHHVGIYVGGGMMIHAPHRGARVRIDPLHSNYVGACRP